MSKLKDVLATQVPNLREKDKKLVEAYGDVAVSQVTVKQVFGGMRGVKSLICDTSEVAPDKGLIIRGIPVMQLMEKLPEEVLWLLMTGKLPNQDELKDLQVDLKARSKVPDYVWNVLRAMPPDSHPMTMFDTAILVMQKESHFARRYNEGVAKDRYWRSTFEDALDIIAKLPEIAAGVYRIRFKDGKLIAPDPNLDWGGNFVHMTGLPDSDGRFKKLMRLYFVLHCDHESGNVSAYSAATVNSALSDLYYSLSAGLNGLAGPLHGLANQECLKWVIEVRDKFNGVPSEQQLREFAWETLKSGKVVPGYGHAVLRVTDPRFDAFLAWGKENCADDEVFQVVARVFDVVPGVLKEIHKIHDPWPNVDAGSGALLYAFGLTEMQYYTVLFAVSRAMGICSQAVLARALMLPITRPKSVTTDWIMKTVSAQD